MMRDKGISDPVPKITVLICTFNEEENIPHVLPKIPDWIDEVIVVDGHSSDSSVEAVRKSLPAARVTYQPNTGKDDAMKHGIEIATGDIIVTLDADGSTDPEEIPRFIEPLLKGYDFTKGSRFLESKPGNMPWYRHFGNWVLATETNILFGTRYTDVCSGYSAFKRDMWKKVSFPEEFGYEPTIIIRVKKAGLKIAEVACTDRGRLSGSSKLPNWRQGWGAFKAILKERLHA